MSKSSHFIGWEGVEGKILDSSTVQITNPKVRKKWSGTYVAPIRLICFLKTWYKVYHVNSNWTWNHLYVLCNFLLQNFIHYFNLVFPRLQMVDFEVGVSRWALQTQGMFYTINQWSWPSHPNFLIGWEMDDNLTLFTKGHQKIEVIMSQNEWEINMKSTYL